MTSPERIVSSTSCLKISLSIMREAAWLDQRIFPSLQNCFIRSLFIVSILDQNGGRCYMIVCRREGPVSYSCCNPKSDTLGQGPRKGPNPLGKGPFDGGGENRTPVLPWHPETSTELSPAFQFPPPSCPRRKASGRVAVQTSPSADGFRWARPCWCRTASG